MMSQAPARGPALFPVKAFPLFVKLGQFDLLLRKIGIPEREGPVLDDPGPSIFGSPQHALPLEVLESLPDQEPNLGDVGGIAGDEGVPTRSHDSECG